MRIMRLVLSLLLSACSANLPASPGDDSGSRNGLAPVSLATATRTPAPTATRTPTPTPQPKQYDVQVSGPSQTDILVAAGDYIWVMAQGEIRLGMFAGFADPGGRSSAFLAGYSTVPELPHGALLCRVTGETWQTCGAEREFQATRSGQLELTVNDDDRANNSGAFDVRIFVSPYSHRTQYLAAQPTGPPSRSATDNPLTSTGNPEQYLAGYVSCWDSFAWVASGDLTNTASRPIEVAITLSISGGGLLGYGSETKAYVIQPGAIESIYFAGPEVASDSSCSVLIKAQWAD